jgi:hypothetical protein
MEIIRLVVRFLILLAEKLPLNQSLKEPSEAIRRPNFPVNEVLDV